MELCENQINVIVVESPEVLTEYVSELKCQISGEEGQFVLSDKDICRIDKMMEMVIDPWTIDFNSKRIKTKLLQLVKEEADEYFYEQPDHTENFYTLDYEPWEQNITSMVDFQSKWADMVAEGVEIPTKPTAERRANYTIGVYEGGGYMTKGMYRPADICRMRDNDATQFCAVCQRAIERIIRFNTEEAGK